MHEPHLELGPRSRNATAWWVAAELVRRHPELLVREEHPMDGHYDCLVLAVGDPAAPAASVQINRGGSVHVFRGDAHETVPMEAFLAVSDPLDPLRFVEDAAGLRPPETLPRSTARSLTYRVLAGALRLASFNPHDWDVRAVGQLTDDWLGGGRWEDPAHVLDRFPAAPFLLRSVEKAGLPEHPLRLMFALTRDQKPLALATTTGLIAVRGDVLDVREAYAAHGRRLFATIGAVLGPVLP